VLPLTACYLKQSTSTFFLFIANLLQISTYPLFCASTNSLLHQTSTPILFIANLLQISTYPLFYLSTNSEIIQSINIPIHHIHCKSPANPYLFPAYLHLHKSNYIKQPTSESIIYTNLQYKLLLTHYFLLPHTIPFTSNNQSPLPSYSFPVQYQYLLTVYFLHLHNPTCVKLPVSASILFISCPISISTYELFCASTKTVISQTTNLNFHHIHCKSPANIYLLSVLCFHENQPSSNFPPLLPSVTST
jgi:hypothetical protein